MLGLLWKGLHKDPHQLPSALIDKPIPAFQYPSLLESNQFINEHALIGQVTLLNVWASWCLACRTEHPMLMEMAKNTRILIYGLNYKDERYAALTWLKDFGNPYKAVIFDHAGSLAINLGVYGAPETFVIDSHGIIRYKYVGIITPAVWQKQIEPEIRKWEPSGTINLNVVPAGMLRSSR